MEVLQELRLWPENRKALPKPGDQATEIQREFKSWHTWTSIIGFPVMGIFPRGVAPDKMNTISVSNGTAGKDDPRARGKLLVAATDMGEVRARAASVFLRVGAGARSEGTRASAAMSRGEAQRARSLPHSSALFDRLRARAALCLPPRPHPTLHRLPAAGPPLPLAAPAALRRCSCSITRR
jgi:hypothetical protein